ncbi:MAG: Chromosomal replication initiator protein DnaA [Candidatus Anoxychlamydiales bacterium]|nr:Chromosomal replication initiator protein DnaA [Candidatus Anoxychlamydiales bacterium]
MKAWKLFLVDLEKKIGSSTVSKWLSSLKILKFDACNLYLEAENYFQAKWFEEHIRPILKKGFYNENFHKIKIHLSIKDSYQKPKTKEIKKQFTSETLQTYLTFSFFIASEKNLITLKLLKEAASSNTSSFNPIFLYGPKGSGKTHILQALAHKFTERNLNVFYVSAKTFTNHVVDAIRNSAMAEFRKTYRNLDVLIVDDAQIFSKKLATQEEFFHTFNTLHSMGKPIILSANSAPNMLDDIEPRLTSRFEWGISLYLEKLKKSDFKLVLKSQQSLLNLHLAAEIEKFIIDNFNNITSIKKALKTIALNEHLDDQKSLDANKIKNYLSPLILEEKEKDLDPEKIIQEVSIYFGLTSKDILGKSQTKECTFPRQFSMYLCRELLKMPFMKIGTIFQRDHSTVMTSIKSIKKELDNNKLDTFSALKQITKKLHIFS